MFCGREATEEKIKVIFVGQVKTTEFRDKIVEICRHRGSDDKWGQEVHCRIQYNQDLFAKDVVYHIKCNVNFSTFKQIPRFFQTAEVRSAGKPIDEERHQAFLRVAEYLKENDNEQLTLSDLCEKMRDYLPSAEKEIYSERYMRQNSWSTFKVSLQ